MNQRNLLAVSVLAFITIAVTSFFNITSPSSDLEPTPRNITLSGTYVCLPHLDTTGPQTEECAFGLKTDDGTHYAVNFGASADAMSQFQSGARVSAEGFVVIKEALSSNQWAKYNMNGIFTITQILGSVPTAGKLDIRAVCQGALAYMTFPNAESANLFVSECIEGKHPEVIERHKKDMNLGDGAQI